MSAKSDEAVLTNPPSSDVFRVEELFDKRVQSTLGWKAYPGNTDSQVVEARRGIADAVYLEFLAKLTDYGGSVRLSFRNGFRAEGLPDYRKPFEHPDHEYALREFADANTGILATLGALQLKAREGSARVEDCSDLCLATMGLHMEKDTDARDTYPYALQNIGNPSSALSIAFRGSADIALGLEGITGVEIIPSPYGVPQADKDSRVL